MTPKALGAGTLELLPPEECFRRLGAARVGRLAVSVGLVPVVFPVNFVLAGDDIFFRTAAGTKLDAALRGAVVSFQVDSVDEEAHAGWSVLAVGRAFVVHDPETLELVERLPLESWARNAGEQVVRIRVRRVTGRELVHS